MNLYLDKHYSNHLIEIAKWIEGSNFDKDFEEFILSNVEPFPIPLKKYEGMLFLQFDRIEHKDDEKPDILVVPVPPVFCGGNPDESVQNLYIANQRRKF